MEVTVDYVAVWFANTFISTFVRNATM